MINSIVTIAQMQAIENRMFAAGMPVAALMEKASLRITQRLVQLFPPPQRVGFLVGAGHNGGDALVVARELFWRGYEVLLYSPSNGFKDLTTQHYQYALSIGIPRVASIQDLKTCDLIVDGLFGYNLDRLINSSLINTINEINGLQIPIVSIDLPSGIHADTGEALGAAIQARHTFCLGLWKYAFAQDQALPYFGQTELLRFDILATDIQAVIGSNSSVQMITRQHADRYLPNQRSVLTHKYQQGHLLLVVGSWEYAGAAILAGLGAQASGVGLLSIAVPNSLKPALLQHLPDAIIIGCPETSSGAIKHLPGLDWKKYTAIAGGCGLTTEPIGVIDSLLEQNLPLVLDADGLNILANLPVDRWQKRSAPLILTPHGGEWRRLFPEPVNRLVEVRQHAERTQTILLSKGARTVISDGDRTWVISNGTPALARGGSGDVLTGLIGGLVAGASAQTQLLDVVASANWWHAQAGSLAAQERGLAGVDALTLSKYLIPTIH
jgi:ADP-dependent NAD(P)H-hydrate dehydratase / NAD(P)H-hydrate epimerase